MVFCIVAMVYGVVAMMSLAVSRSIAMVFLVVATVFGVVVWAVAMVYGMVQGM